MKSIKRLVLLAAVVLFVFVLCGCGTEAKQEASEPNNQEVSAGEKADNGDKLQFAYLASFLSHESYQRILRGMQKEADDNNINLMVADSNNDAATQVSQMETFISQKVDCMLVTAVEPRSIKKQVEAATAAGIPVVSEAYDIGGGEKTVVGNDMTKNGIMLGEWLAEKSKAENLDMKILIIGYPALPAIVGMQEGFVQALEDNNAKFEVVAEVDGQALKEQALAKATDALTAHPEVNVIFGINDDSVLGGIQAAKALGMDATKMITLTNDLAGNGSCQAMKEDSTLTAACAIFPELYGAYLMRAGIEAVEGKELPPLYETLVEVVTIDTFDQYYEKQGDDYVLKIDEVRAMLEG